MFTLNLYNIVIVNLAAIAENDDYYTLLCRPTSVGLPATEVYRVVPGTVVKAFCISQ